MYKERILSKYYSNGETPLGWLGAAGDGRLLVEFAEVVLLAYYLVAYKNAS